MLFFLCYNVFEVVQCKILNKKMTQNMKEAEAHILEEEYKNNKTTKEPWKKDTVFRICALLFVLFMLLGIIL